MSTFAIMLFLFLLLGAWVVHAIFEASTVDGRWRAQFGIRAIFFVATLVAAICGIIRLPVNDMLKFCSIWMLFIVAYGWALRQKKPFGVSVRGSHSTAQPPRAGESK
jgi:hypothetical protein